MFTDTKYLYLINLSFHRIQTLPMYQDESCGQKASRVSLGKERTLVYHESVARAVTTAMNALVQMLPKAVVSIQKAV
jgi:hypothetical protein